MKRCRLLGATRCRVALIKKVAGLCWSNLASLPSSARATAAASALRSPLSVWSRTARCVSECIAIRSLSSTVTSACCFNTNTAFLSVLLSSSVGAPCTYPRSTPRPLQAPHPSRRPCCAWARMRLCAGSPHIYIYIYIYIYYMYVYIYIYECV